jgi:alpha-D-xyloside xylohydrolase
MGIISIEGKEIVFNQRGEVARISAFGENCIRFRSSANGEIIDQDWNLLSQPAVETALSENAEGAVLRSGILSVEINKNGQLRFLKRGKEILVEQSEFAFNYRFRQYRRVASEVFRATLTFKADPEEHFYGMGQDPHARFDLKGCVSDLIHKNTKSSIPFVYSSKGYGFLWNNPAIGRAEFGHNRTQWESNACRQVDYLVLAGDGPAEVMGMYARLTGYAPHFPAWASGFWQCKLRYESQEDLLAVARKYHTLGVPVSVIVVDFFHWTEQGDWRFDPRYWPDPKAMVGELESMGMRLMVSIWPTVHPDSVNFKELDDKRFLLRTEQGQYGIFYFHGPLTYLDATNPAAREFFWEKIRLNYLSLGVRCFWLDEAEPDIDPVNFHNLRMNAGNGEEVGLLYPFRYAQIFHDGLVKEGEKDPLSLIRAAWIGSQRYGTLLWSGDVPSTFESLRQQVREGLSVAMCGIPWWTSDIGGFHGADIKSDSFRELILRWFQFGLFSPVMRLHGARNRPDDHVQRHPEVLEGSGGDNEIWSFGEESYPILKQLIELREKLRPYIHQHMDKASQTGIPLMRPMFFDFSDDESCYGLEDQYLFGDDILFAPILDQGRTSRSVYLPGNLVWVDVNDGREHTGPRSIDCRAEKDRFLAFVKKGSSVLESFSALKAYKPKS